MVTNDSRIHPDDLRILLSILATLALDLAEREADRICAIAGNHAAERYHAAVIEPLTDILITCDIDWEHTDYFWNRDDFLRDDAGATIKPAFLTEAQPPDTADQSAPPPPSPSR